MPERCHLTETIQKHKRPEGGVPPLASGVRRFGVHSFASGDFMVPEGGYIFDSGYQNLSSGVFAAPNYLIPPPE